MFPYQRSCLREDREFLKKGKSGNGIASILDTPLANADKIIQQAWPQSAHGSPIDAGKSA
jgi:hypothetical protein